MKILSSKQMYQADLATIQKKPILSLNLMEHASLLCFNWISNYLTNKNQIIHIFCGIGNNGGDGLVIARKLIQNKYEVKTYIVNFSNKRSDDFIVNYNRLLKLKHKPNEINSFDDFPLIKNNELIIDAIFGIGLSRSPEGFVKELIQCINESNTNTISIDLPSGLFSESHVFDTDAVVRSTEVLTFQNPKIAFLIPDNQKYIKNWHVLDIGLDQDEINSMETNYYIIDKSKIRSIYTKREKFSHKGTFGHSLIIGGSYGKIGAVVLASKAALKIGSGLVTAYIPKCGYEIVQTSIPEVMVEVDAEEQLEFFNYKSKATVIGIGVGIGTGEKTCIGFRKFLKENRLPLIIDADGLNILAKHNELLSLIPENSVLTPHPQEFKRLVGKWKNDYEKIEKLIEFSSNIDCVIVLKGAYTAIAFQNKIYFNTTGNPALATAGSGDVLTGIITGLIAQKHSPLNAAILGVYLHGKTADIAIENNQSMETFTASDCIDYFGKVFKGL